MKRSELKVGLEVDVQGRYDQFDQAVVLDTRPWSDGKFSDWSPFRPRQVSNGQGVAVAVRQRYVSQGQQPSWRPAVVQLSRVKPAGTEAALDRQKQAERESREATAQRLDREETVLRERAGVTSQWDLRFRYTHDRLGPSHRDSGMVEVKRSVLERLLEEAGR